jgi:hypothetical protein
MRELIWTTTVVVILSGMALAQAIAEGALTHGAAASASAGAGKALGGIANQLAGKLGQQTSNAMHPAVTTVKPEVQRRTMNPGTRIPQTATTTSATPNSGSLIASVQGAAPPAPEAKCGPATESNSPQDAPKPSNCGVRSHPVGVDQAAHPSEITLPAAK